MDSLTEMVGSALLHLTEKAGWKLPIHMAAATANGAANVAICFETGDGEVKWEFLFSDGMPMQLPFNINVRGRARGPTFAEKQVGAVQGMRTWLREIGREGESASGCRSSLMGRRRE